MNSNHSTLSKRDSENRLSTLLTRDENELIIQMLGRKCVTLATGVVQLLLTSAPSHQDWQTTFIGVVCFVKDSNRRSYFIRIYNIVKPELVWEQELYTQFTYLKLRPFLHCFEAQDCMAGLSFASEQEAENFHSVVESKLQHRQQKKQEKRRSLGNSLQTSKVGVSLPNQSAPSHGSEINSRSNKQSKKSKKKTEKKKTLTKADIGMPTGFKHVKHVGFKSSTGFEIQQMDNVDDELKDFFNVAGISDQELADKETRDFIYDFINQNGGIAKAKQEIIKPRAPPPVPSRELPPTPKLAARGNAPPPPPPARTTPIASPVRLINNTPPPPPPSRPPLTVSKANAPLPPPPPPLAPPAAVSMGLSNNIPPPPPPPPPPADFFPPPPPPPPCTSDAPGSPFPPPPPPLALDPRAAMMAQIKEGRKLNTVDNSANETRLAVPSDPRNMLLQQIREGIELKNIPDVVVNKIPPPSPSCGLADKLRKALEDRAQAMQGSDDSDSADEDSDRDEEWED